MATIANLHTSISELSDDKIFTLIRHLRELRREIPIKVAKTPKKSAKKTKNKKQKQLTIEDHIGSMQDVKREELLKKLLAIRKEKKNG